MARPKENGRQRRIFNLWCKSPFCNWCGRVTVLIFRTDGIKMPMRKDEATLDHLNDRYGERPNVQGVETTVLACWECNGKRGHEATKARPVEELWERSGSYPQGHPNAKPNQRDLRGGLES